MNKFANGEPLSGKMKFTEEMRHATARKLMQDPTLKMSGYDRALLTAISEGKRVLKCNVAHCADALKLLKYLPDACAALTFFDPQHRGVLDKLKFGNEDSRQRGRAELPAMTEDYIDAVCREIARVLVPGGYCMRWLDTFGLCEAHHLRTADVLKPVDLIAWDNLRMGMGKRSRRRGDYLLILQKPPIHARTWRDHGIPSRWPEKVDRKIHPHIKPQRLIKRLIGAVTLPGDLVIDPAAGGFGVLIASLQLGRKFIGCDADAATVAHFISGFLTCAG